MTPTIFDGVMSMTVHDGKLVIGGQFSGFPGNPNIIQYDGTNFTALGAGGANSNVRALRSTGTRLYAGGDFTSIGGVAANRVAYWDGAWHSTPQGTDGFVAALGVLGSEIHVGGAFATVDDDAAPPAIASPFWA